MFCGEFDTIAPGKEANDLTSNEIKKYIDSLVPVESEDFQYEVIESTIKVLRVRSKIADPEARMMTYVVDFLNHL